MKNPTYTLFCLDIVSAQVLDTITTGGNGSFADYVSCNDNGNATDPQCVCDNAIDRRIGGLDVNKYCRQADGSSCDEWHDCHCTCTRSSSQYSATYTGMMPVVFRGQTLGAWYSHPKATECAENEDPG